MRRSNRAPRVPRPAELRRRTRTTVLLCVALLPTAAACGSSEPASQQSSVSPTTTTISVPPPSSSTWSPSVAPTVDPYAGQPLIDHVEWTEAVDGARLRVYPTTAGRHTNAADAEQRAWQEVLDQSPDAGTPGMADQFRCHWDWARLIQPDKPSWNLEPWRPAVGHQATVEAHCNPGGPER